MSADKFLVPIHTPSQIDGATLFFQASPVPAAPALLSSPPFRLMSGRRSLPPIEP